MTETWITTSIVILAGIWAVQRVAARVRSVDTGTTCHASCRGCGAASNGPCPIGSLRRDAASRNAPQDTNSER